MDKEKHITKIIFFTILVDMLGVGVLIPIFPMLIATTSPFRITPPSWTYQENVILLGWLLTCFPLAQFFASPILGQLADRFGRKNILSISIAGTAISYILFAIGVLNKNLPLLFIARIIDGMSGGNISVAQAVIGDVSSAKNRAKNFGLIGMTFGLGFIIGPVIGGKLSDPELVSWFNVATPFWFATILSFINAFLVIKLLPETLPNRIIKKIDITRPIQNIVKAFTYEGLKSVVPATFCFNVGFTFFTTFWGVVLAEQFNFTQGKIGNFYGYVGIMIVLAQAIVVRGISGRVKDYKILRFSVLGSGLCLFGYYLIQPTHYQFIYFIPPIMATCNSLSMAFGVSLLTRITPAEVRGEVMGINSSVNALGQAIPAILAGYIASHHARLPILVGGICVCTGWIVFLIIFKPQHFNKIS